MRYSLSILDADFQVLRAAVFSITDREGAAYLLCGRSVTVDEVRFLVQEVHPVREQDYLRRERLSLSIRSDSYVHVVKRARARGWSVIFVHSHVTGIPEHSSQDDAEEPRLMGFFGSRVPGVPHGSMVACADGTMVARSWNGTGWEQLTPIRVLGDRFRFLFAGLSPSVNVSHFDRQVRAFGEDLQRLLARVHVGIVGAGGTGSAVAEQLTRLGVGTVSLFDGDVLEASNVTRVYGSTLNEVGRNKAEVLGTHLRSIGLGTNVRIFPHHILRESIAKELRACDVVFGCTDKHLPRALLVQLTTLYLIPIFDLGVKITSDNGALRGVHGRITFLLPPEACLWCRGRIDAQRAAQEMKPQAEQVQLAQEGYAPELETNAPAVVSFTTAVAAQAVTEFLDRCAGFSSTSAPGEVLLFLHDRMIRRNRIPRRPDCACASDDFIGSGDGADPYLGVTWMEDSDA